MEDNILQQMEVGRIFGDKWCLLVGGGLVGEVDARVEHLATSQQGDSAMVRARFGISFGGMSKPIIRE